MSDRSKKLIIGALAIATLILVPAAAIGSTLADYQRRLESARTDVESMISALQNGSQLTGNEDGLFQQAISRVRRAMPANETVELGGPSIETQNGWLQAELNNLEQASNQADRIKILSGVSERLSSINEHVKNLQSAVAGTRTKDEDKQKLSEILSREEYQKPENKGESAFQRWVKWFIDWIRSLFPDQPILPKETSGFQPLSVVIQVIVYALVIGLVGFLIYKFAPVIAERFRQKEKKERTGRVVLGEHIDASLSASDLFAEAESFAQRGDLRAAIRKGYIALLCDLADKKVIGLARHKTNRDYLRDLRKRTSLFARIKNATGSFERHWYGFRTPETEDWEEFREQYRSALNELG